ncbi:hypothetical protein [Modicisalibacter muralis]|uniref:hypothetical protein n=1 Tax=Modicisalibacter muralis TaxID=119000 RepID=UPI000B7DFF45|nr:hypothetical protein [Halomonas muralis]
MQNVAMPKPLKPRPRKSLPLKPSSRHSRGATRRQPASPDRWLDRLLDIAVLSALVVGGAALLISWVVD